MTVLRLGLTAKQRKVLNFIRSYLGTHGYSPSFEEIKRGCWLASKSQVSQFLTALEAKGRVRNHRIRGDYRAARSIEVLDPPIVINGDRFLFIPKSHAAGSIHGFRRVVPMRTGPACGSTVAVNAPQPAAAVESR